MTLNINSKATPDSFEKQVIQEALGNPLELNREPTTSNGDLKGFQIGFYSGNLYINIFGTTYKISLTQV